jgi:hypothetical protein
MAEEIALSIKVESDRAQMSLGELETGFAGLQTQLKATNRRTEEGRKQFKELSGQMALASKEIKNIELGFEGLDREQVASEFGGLAGGIGDVTASLVLMGGENETIEQMGRSIETAMAISMGLKGAIEGVEAGMKLYNSVIKSSTLFQKLNNAVTVIAATVMKLFKGSVDATSKSFKTLKTAIAATGIGLLVIGVAALVANFGKIKDAINGVSTASNELLESTDKMVETNQKNLDTLDNQTNALKLQGFTEREIINMKLEAQKKVVDGLIAELDANKIINKEKIEGAERNQKILIKTAEFLFIIPRTLLQIFDFLGNSITSVINEVTQSEVGKKLFGLEPITIEMGLGKATDDLLDQATRMLFDPEATEIEGQKELEVLESNLLKQRDALAGHKLSLQALDKKGRDEATKVQTEADKKAKEDAEALAAFNEEQARLKIELIQDEGERKRAEIKYNSELELEALEKTGMLTMNAEMAIYLRRSEALAAVTKEEDDKKLEAEKEAQAKRDEYDKTLKDTKLQNDLAQAESEEQIRIAEAEILKQQVTEDFENKLLTLQEQGLLTMELKTELLYAEEQALAAIEDEFREKKKQADIAAAQESLTASTQVIGALGDLNKMALDNDLKNAGNNDKKKEQIRKASFEREKKLNIAMALVNGAQAQMAILAQTPKADFGVATAIAMAAAAVTTIAQIAAIKKTSYQGGGSPAGGGGGSVNSSGAGSGGGGAQITPVTNTSTIIGDQQVYVTETDITSTQNQVNVIEESATF